MKDNIPRTKCPYCDYKIDSSTSVFDGGIEQIPKPGDYSLCLNCGKVSVFTETMGVRLPTTEEAMALAADERIITAQLMQASVVREDLRK